MEFTKEQAAEKAKFMFAHAQEKDFPEDDWQAICDNWDLNLWLDDNGKPRATIYPVLGGNVDVFGWIKIV